MKQCTKCAARKPVSDFYHRDGRPIGPCKVCVIAKTRAWELANRARKNALSRKWKAAHREYAHAYYCANKEKQRLQARAWKVRNGAKVLAAQAGYRRRHKAALREKAYAWRAKNPESVRATKRRCARNETKNLSSSYVRKLLVYRWALRPDEVPRELIDLKRETMKIKRLLKESNA
jgi:hypothetical protein